MKNQWQHIFNSFNQLNCLVIGDVMVDNYMCGKVNRISPEAPVPIVLVEEKESRLGGAANVALNIQALGATPIVCSVIGKDESGKLFHQLLKKNKLSSAGIVQSAKRKTTVKTRIIAQTQQVLRVDEELENDLNDSETNLLFEKIETLIKKEKIDVVVFEDYDKGVITKKLIENVISLAKSKNIPVAVDPKKRNFNFYKGATLFKPNFKELKEGTKTDVSATDISEIKKIVGKIKSEHNFENVLLTLSSEGVLIYNNSVQKLIPAHLRAIADVSGAGDTVISVAALCIALKISSVKMAELSNLAGGLVCEQVGVVPVNKQQLLQEAIKCNI